MSIINNNRFAIWNRTVKYIIDIIIINKVNINCKSFIFFSLILKYKIKLVIKLIVTKISTVIIIYSN